MYAGRIRQYYGVSVSSARLTLLMSQTRFPKELDVSETDALMDITEEDAIVQFNLAPLSVRRDVAMLGLIHRAVLGDGPEQLKQFFHRSPEGPRTCKSRLAARRHNKQLVDPRNCGFLEIKRRSALGLVAVYNLLPQVAVDITSVKAFQSQLQNIVKRELHLQNPEWQQLLSPRVPIYRHQLIYIDV